MNNNKKTDKKTLLITAAAAAGMLAATYIGSLFATMYLHNAFINNLQDRIRESNPNVVIDEHDFESDGLFSIGKNFSIRNKEGTYGINVILQSKFTVPFLETTRITLNHPNGKELTCDGCDFQSFAAGGQVNISYFSNSYNGTVAIPTFSTGKKISVMVNPGTVTFAGKFADRAANFDVNLEGIKYTDSVNNIRRNLDKVTGKLSVSIVNNRFFVQTDGLQIGQFYINDRLHSDKLVLSGINLKIKNENSSRTDLIDSTVSISAKSLSYDNEAYDAELNTNRIGVLVKFENVDQGYLAAVTDIAKSLYAFLHEDNHRFDYNVLSYFADRNSNVKIDHIVMVSTQSVGKFEIEKDSFLSFNGSGKQTMKERADLGLKFKVTEQFLSDFPNHLRIKQLFITENGWLVHGSNDSKDEYSTKLTIRNGQCTLGEYFLDNC